LAKVHIIVMSDSRSRLILLTGATGFVGRQVLRALVERNCKVRLIVRDASYSKVVPSDAIEAVITTPDLWSASVTWCDEVCRGVDIVIHAAWYAEPGQYLRSPKNLDCLAGTLRLSQGASRAKVRRFIGIGTCFEYDLSAGHLTVATPLRPSSPYAAAKAAIDMALYDRMGKELGQPLYRIWGLDPSRTTLTSYTIGISDTEDMLRKVRAAKDYPVLKIKMGHPGDLEQLRAIRAITDQVIRVDANAAWEPKEALYKIDAMAELSVEFVEQPLPPRNVEGMRWLHRRSRLPLIVDESCLTNDDIPALVDQCDGINIKLMKCGGLYEALRMIFTARAHHLQVMLGSMIESSVANTAMAHLSPLVDYADLDGHVLIANDPYLGLKLEQGKIVLPDGPGLGVKLREGVN